MAHDLVELTRQAQKALKKVPFYIARKLLDWVEDVEERGIREVRKIPGFHDEPLQGTRLGQRSIRLSKAYRVIYSEHHGSVTIVKVLEVNKHDY